MFSSPYSEEKDYIWQLWVCVCLVCPRLYVLSMFARTSEHTDVSKCILYEYG